ncbi:MAG: hypothetical protein JST00_38635 [Deltaproteobacteria bacterium]|nr:hypothetical protein [Deltaproteobacteria bacterium]
MSGMVRLLRTMLPLTAVIVGTSCGSPPIRMGERAEPEPSTMCPSGITGARLRIVDTDDGVAFVLKAFGDVHDVRKRARDAAAMYGPGSHRGRGHAGTHGEGQHHGLALDRLGVPVVAEASDTADGARIAVRPKDPADLPKLREAAAARESRARAGGC